jgi:signal transduction histidine kinase
LEAKDGGIIAVSVSAAAILDSQGGPKGVVLTLQDITQRKQTEEELRQRQKQLRRLARQLSISEEGQRKTIAEDLHDSVTQLLGVSLFRLRNLVPGLADPQKAAEVGEICHDLDQALTHTRTLTIDISPPALYDLGLGPALEWLAENMRERYGLAVDFKWDGTGEGLGEDIRIALYRSARELLINVHKHAGVRQALLEVYAQDSLLNVTVADQGAGFSPQEASRQSEDGFGLFSIGERLELLGGKMDIEAQPGRGCRVTLRAPLAVADQGGN